MIQEKMEGYYNELLNELDIPEMYSEFPGDFQVDVKGWSFPDDRELAYYDVLLTPEEIKELSETNLLDKIEHLYDNIYRVKRLRTLEIELASDVAIDAMNALRDRFLNGEFKKKDGTADEDALKGEFASLYRDTCTQRCPHCFNQEDDFYVSRIINGQKLLRWTEMKKILLTAKRFGLESVKFLGIGEIFKIPELFEILNDLKLAEIKIGIFTKGTALGDDDTAKKCGYAGISTAEELVKALSEYKNVSILLGGNSFVPKIQDEMVGCGKDGGVVSYTQKRNNALKLLVKYGFNNPAYGKRLALIAAPVSPQTSDETVVMYEWAMRRNIPVITIPTMVSGKGVNELEWLIGQFEKDQMLINRYDPSGELTREERYVEWLVDFYTDIYLRAVDMGINDLANILEEGISGYAGAAKCQEKQNGMYIRLTGTVQECPGRCIGAEIEGDVRSANLITTWVGSKNYDRTKECRSLCAVKMKDITGKGVKVCDCCTVYDNVGSMPPELEMCTLERLEKLLVS